MSRLVTLAAALLLAAPALALDIPTLAGRVNDNANLLTEPQRSELQQKLSAIEAKSGHQFVFLSVETLGGQSIEEFSVATAHAWKLGDKKRDDGLLFVIAKSERKLRLEVGYGLEGSIPDAAAVRMVRDVAAPYLKRGDWAGGIGALFDACDAATSKPVEAAAIAAPAKKTKGVDEDSVIWAVWLALAAFAGIIWASIASMRRNERREEQRRLEREAMERSWRARQGPSFVSSYSPPSTRTASVAAASTATTASKPAKARNYDTEYSSPSSSSYDSGSSSSGSSSSYDSGSSSDSSSSDSFSGGGGDFGGGGASGDF